MITLQDIEEGLEQNQFCLYYQPKFSMVSGQIAGSEALIRWKRPDGVVLQPAEFIGLAEGTALIKKISTYILPILLRDIPALATRNLLPVSFNVTARDFEDDVFARRVLAAIAVAGIPAAALVAEITENQALNCDKGITSNLFLLREAGVGLSMDDYGLGYSSADTLSKWPFSSIKIDQGLVGRMLSSDKSAAIVRSAIRLGHELRIEVVAEGVETVEQYQFLLESGCKSVQGFLICKPLSLDELMAREYNHGFARFPVGLIHMAIVDHLQWRRQIVSYAYQRADLPADSPARQAPGHPALSYCDCRLGQWFYSDGQKFSEHPEFLNLEISHRRLHAVGVELVRRVQAGADRTDVTACVAQLQDASMQMLAHLTLLENYELSTVYQGAVP